MQNILSAEFVRAPPQRAEPDPGVSTPGLGLEDTMSSKCVLSDLIMKSVAVSGSPWECDIPEGELGLLCDAGTIVD